MAKMLNISIDVTKIDKSKLIVGEKGTYLNLTVSVNDEKDNYGNDVSAWIGQTKDEVQAKAPKHFLGNGRVFWEGTSNKPSAIDNGNTDNNDDDGLPF